MKIRRLVATVLALAVLPLAAAAGSFDVDHGGSGKKGSSKRTHGNPPTGCFGSGDRLGSSGTGLAGAIVASSLNAFLFTKAAQLTNGISNPLANFAAWSALDIYSQLSQRAFASSGLGLMPQMGGPLPLLLTPQGEHTPGAWFLSPAVVGMSATLGQPYVSPQELMATPAEGGSASDLQ